MSHDTWAHRLVGYGVRPLARTRVTPTPVTAAPPVPGTPPADDGVDDRQQARHLRAPPRLGGDAPVDDEVDDDHRDGPEQESREAPHVAEPTILSPGVLEFLFDRLVVRFRHLQMTRNLFIRT